MERSKLVKKLSKLKVSKVEFEKGYVSLVFDGQYLKNKAIRRHTKSIGNWSRKRKAVYYDPDLKKEDVIPILIHEVVEKYVTEKYGLDVDKESHEIGDAVEKSFIASRSWRAHQQRIAEDKIHKENHKEK